MLSRLYPAQQQYAPRDEAAVAMRSALENMVGCPPGKTPTPRQVGNKLRHFRRRVWQGQYLDFNANEYSRGGSVWRLLSCERAQSESQSDSLPGADSQSRTESQSESQP
jgi:hypothetical protein